MVRLIVQLAVKEGQSKAFSDVIDELILAHTAFFEGKTAAEYSFYLSEDGTSCSCFEEYPDGDAILSWTASEAYLAIVPRLIPETCDITSVEVLGDPGPAAELLASMDARFVKGWKQELPPRK
jgi:quinol monooxygenase YgiN